MTKLSSTILWAFVRFFQVQLVKKASIWTTMTCTTSMDSCLSLTFSAFCPFLARVQSKGKSVHECERVWVFVCASAWERERFFHLFCHNIPEQEIARSISFSFKLSMCACVLSERYLFSIFFYDSIFFMAYCIVCFSHSISRARLLCFSRSSQSRSAFSPNVEQIGRTRESLNFARSCCRPRLSFSSFLCFFDLFIAIPNRVREVCYRILGLECEETETKTVFYKTVAHKCLQYQCITIDIEIIIRNSKPIECMKTIVPIWIRTIFYPFD